jgi:hypothetical protein
LDFNVYRYTVPQGKKKGESGKEKCYYHLEDAYLWPEAEASFTYMTTFRVTDDDGNKQSVQGVVNGGNETQFKLVYIIKMATYLKQVQLLQKMMMK